MESLHEIRPFKLWMTLFLVLLLRYIVVAGVPYLWLYILGKNKFKTLKIQNNHPERKQILKELKYSIITLLIYSSGVWIFLYWLKKGYTKNYSEIDEFGLPYFLLSIFIMIVLHDAYSYWTHRLIHHKKLFKYVHLLHHTFKNPSPWCAFAFHPLESILTLGIIPMIIFLIPWHHSALIVFVTIMIFYDTFVHLGYNIKLFKIFQWQNTSEDHDVHHRNSKFNFGLYFTFWDRLMGTYLKPS